VKLIVASAVASPVLVFVVGTVMSVSAYQHQPAPSIPTLSPALADALNPPVEFIPMYVEAATKCPGMPWPLLEAIHFQETRLHGDIDPTDQGEVSSAGALGPMQFMPDTWYGAGGYGNGGNIYLVRDSIAAAGRLLCDNGAANPTATYKPDPSGTCPNGIPTGGIPGAIYAYNHDCSRGGYVDQVLGNMVGLIDKIAKQATTAVPTPAVN
jgi:hypothetical protein